MSHFCNATAKHTGNQCGNLIDDSEKVCYIHGGRTRQAKAGAERRKKQALASEAVATYGLPREIAPDLALVEEVHRTVGHVSWLYALVTSMDEDELKQRDMTGRFEKASVWVELYQAERAHLIKVAKSCLDAGVAERQVTLAEAQGVMLASVLRDVIAGVFGALAERGLPADVLGEAQREDVPGIVRSRLALVAPTAD